MPAAWLVVPVAFAIIVGLLTALAVLREGRPDAFVESDPPASYRISYRLDEFGEQRTRLLTVTVRRPFEAHVILTELDGSTVFGTVSTADGLYEVVDPGSAFRPAEVRFAERRTPSPSEADVRPLLLMDRAISEGIAFAAGLDEIAGRRCTRFVVGSPFGTALRADGPRARTSSIPSRTELCVDAGGLVLEEKRFANGTPELHRTAIDVEVDPDLPPDLFTPPREIPGRVAEQVPIARPVDEVLAAAAARLDGFPAGFSVHSSLMTVADPERIPVRTIVAYESATSAVVVETINGEHEWPRRASSSSVRVGGRSAVLILDPVANEVRFEADGGPAVRVTGSVRPEVLLDIAGRLRFR